MARAVLEILTYLLARAFLYIYLIFFHQHLSRQPNPERGYSWTFKIIIHEHLWLIDGHFWRKNKNIYVETMRQPNPGRGYSWTFKNNNSWTFMTHWWTFLTKKNKDIYVETMRQPNPERGYSWQFKNNNSWTFMAHWWTFMTKNTNSRSLSRQ